MGDPEGGDTKPGTGRGRRRRRRDVREAAIALLARRDYSRVELERSLDARGYAPGEVATLMAELVETRALDDVRFAHNYASYHAARGQGPVRIRVELEALGLGADLIDAALAGEQDWRALAREQRTRRFGPGIPASPAE